jgi:hypothetical protein
MKLVSSEDETLEKMQASLFHSLSSLIIARSSFISPRSFQKRRSFLIAIKPSRFPDAQADKEESEE